MRHKHFKSTYQLFLANNSLSPKRGLDKYSFLANQEYIDSLSEIKVALLGDRSKNYLGFVVFFPVSIILSQWEPVLNKAGYVLDKNIITVDPLSGGNWNHDLRTIVHFPKVIFLVTPIALNCCFVDISIADLLPPFLFGGGMVGAISREKFAPLSGVDRFTAGTIPVAQVIWIRNWLRLLC